MWVRVSITILTAVQAMIAAYLGFGDYVPQEWKVAMVVASAGIAVVLNQLPRFQDPRQQGDGSWMSSPPPPRG